MVTYIRYRILKIDYEKFSAAIAEGITILRNFEPCEAFEFSRCISEPENYILRIEWSASNDSVDFGQGSEIFQAFMEKTETFREYILEMRNYSPVMVEN